MTYTCSSIDINGNPTGNGHRMGIDQSTIQTVSNTNSDHKTTFLGNNYPNPFNNNTMIPYYISQAGTVEINITDVYGNNIVNLLTENNHEKGEYLVEFNAAGLTSGIYYYSLKAQDYFNVRRMVVIK